MPVAAVKRARNGRRTPRSGSGRIIGSAPPARLEGLLQQPRIRFGAREGRWGGNHPFLGRVTE